MPLVQFICPDKEKVRIERCLSGDCRMRMRCAPLGYLQLCAKQRPWTGKPSVTQLIDGTRRQYLMLTTDYAESPQDGAWRVLGTKAHAGLDMDNSLSFTEEDLEFEGVTGTTDLIEQQSDGKLFLIDHKVSGSYKVVKAIGLRKLERVVLGPNDQPLKHRNGKVVKDVSFARDEESVDVNDWKLQLNSYRIALEKTTGFHIDGMKVFCIVRDGATYIAKQRGIIDNFYYIDIPFMRDIDIARHLETKRDALIKAVTDKKSPSPCSEDEAWGGNKCKLCPVAGECVKTGNPYIAQLQSEEE